MSKILVFGGTGYLGKHMVRASIMMGHPTYVYGRPINPNTHPSKLELHKEFKSMGVTLIQGELSEHEKLVSIVQQIDIVICVLGAPHIMEQLKIIDAMKIAGNVKRFIPSEFGVEDERVVALPLFQDYLDKRRKIRSASIASGIPYSFLSSTAFGAYFLNFLFHQHDQSQELTIYGTGEAKVVFTHEQDIAIYAIKVANDPRTCNRTIFYRPSRSIASQLDLVAMWEKKTGRNYKKMYIPEEEIVKLSETSAHPHNLRAAIIHSIFVKGDMANFELREDDMEVSKLYPDFEYTTVDQLLDDLVTNAPKFEYAVL
ncbi:isoeugenol synthase 1-like [Actinidia eriantha]|uniref:isoeugenol synthase 1-like n=1 Tax=Actinidia eriantha TaxID=165200 RepID=UPI00258B1642|nr:isoeugenol synthase 1-like [Actinidia eriantha]